MDTVEIRLKQVSFADFEPAYFDGLSKFNNVGVGMRDAYALRKAREIQFLKGWHVSNSAIGNKGGTAQDPRDLGVNLAKQRTGPWSMIDILQHDNLWLWYARHVFPPIHSVVVTEVCNRRRRRTQSAGHSVAGNTAVDWKRRADLP